MTLDKLNLHIELSSHLLTDQERSFSNFIRIEPEKWVHTLYSNNVEVVEFFVVAIFGHKVIYYHDFEEGFNISEYKEYGKLLSPGANQNDFHEFISHLFAFVSSTKP